MSNIEFQNPLFLWLFLFLLLILILNKLRRKNTIESLFSKEVLEKISINSHLTQKSKNLLLFTLLSFVIVALSRPIINNGKIEVESISTQVVVAFDISHSMQAQDIYPNRFLFAKQKFFTILEKFKDISFGVQIFSNQAYLISPISKDTQSIKYLVQNISLEYVSRNGTNIMASLEVTNELQKETKNKSLLIFTDGGDNKNFEKELKYAKENNIKIYIYAIASKKGAPIKKKNEEFIKDEKGNLVITKLNENIKNLALKSGGAYLEYSLNKNDIKKIMKEIKSNTKKKVEKKSMKNTKELFYYPLTFALILFLVLSLSFRKKLLS